VGPCLPFDIVLPGRKSPSREVPSSVKRLQTPSGNPLQAIWKTEDCNQLMQTRSTLYGGTKSLFLDALQSQGPKRRSSIQLQATRRVFTTSRFAVSTWASDGRSSQSNARTTLAGLPSCVKSLKKPSAVRLQGIWRAFTSLRTASSTWLMHSACLSIKSGRGTSTRRVTSLRSGRL
jgi:hypothetical protein